MDPDVRTLPNIAARTGIGKILKNRPATVLPAYDVIELMGKVGIHVAKEAILAAPTGAIRDQESQGIPDIRAQAE
jgi:hypothetical protein